MKKNANNLCTIKTNLVLLLPKVNEVSKGDNVYYYPETIHDQKVGLLEGETPFIKVVKVDEGKNPHQINVPLCILDLSPEQKKELIAEYGVVL
jgi:hypothetical protein